MGKIGKICKTFVLCCVFILGIQGSVISADAATSKGIAITNLPSDKLTLKQGAKFTLKVKVTGLKSKTVTFRTSNKKVATVSSKGKITAKKNGTAKITITSKVNKKKKTTVQVTVGTPVKKLNVSEKAFSVEVGNKKTIKTSVLPQKASNKKVSYRSSNTKVATVTSKGVVTGKKAGKAKITVSSLDGSGKKVVCNVTVTEKSDSVTITPVTLTDVSFWNGDYIKVTLSSPQRLEVENFLVSVKEPSENTYQKTAKILALDRASEDMNRVYYLSIYGMPKAGGYVKITVNGLNGTGTISKELHYTVSQECGTKNFYATAGEKLKNQIYDYQYSKITDYLTVSDLPAGVSYVNDKEKKTLIFSGIPEKEGECKTKLVFWDGIGTEHIYYIQWTIVGENTVVAYSYRYEEREATREDIGTESTWDFYALGGSGNYDLEVAEGGSQFHIETKEEHYQLVGRELYPGTYKITVKVTDRENKSLSASVSVTIYVYTKYKVTGRVVDGQGKPISGAKVHASTSYVYYPMSEDVCTDEEGYYTMYLVGASYDFTAQISDYSSTLERPIYGLEYRCIVVKADGKIYQKDGQKLETVDFTLVIENEEVSGEAVLDTITPQKPVKTDEICSDENVNYK